MNSAASAYSSHSYYGGGAVLSTGNHAASSAVLSQAAWPHSNSTGLPNVFDYYNQASSVTDYYGASYPSRYPTAASSTGTPSPHSFDNNSYWAAAAAANHNSADQIYNQLTGNLNYCTQYALNNAAGKKRGGVGNSKKERKRTISINGAFSNLRDCIPNVPKDTKLSKIKTLRLACGYIQHLMDALESDDPQPLEEFKADLSRKTPCRAEKRKCIEEEIAAAAERKCRGRSGWPQTIWAQDLKSETVSTAPNYVTSSHLSHQSPGSLNQIHPSNSHSQIHQSQESCGSSVASSQSHLENMDIIGPSPSYHSSLCEESPLPSADIRL